MSADFVPYLNNLKKGQASNAAGPPAQEPGSEGKPFAPLVSATAPKPVAAPLPHTPTACGATVSVTRDGNRVTRIQVKCSCGEVIELACSY